MLAPEQQEQVLQHVQHQQPHTADTAQAARRAAGVADARDRLQQLQLLHGAVPNNCQVAPALPDEEARRQQASAVQDSIDELRSRSAARVRAVWPAAVDTPVPRAGRAGTHEVCLPGCSSLVRLRHLSGAVPRCRGTGVEADLRLVRQQHAHRAAAVRTTVPPMHGWDERGSEQQLRAYV